MVLSLVLAATLSLGRAESFSILAGSGVKASGPMRVTGNVGAGTGGVTGVSPVVGEILPGGDALKDVEQAWDKLGSLCAGSDPCVLPDDIWVFRADHGLTLPDSSIQLPAGFQSNHVFWRVDGDVTLSERSTFVGTLIARGNITVKEGVTVSGRLISRQGSVTLTTDDINLCCEPIEMSSLPDGAEKVSYSKTILPGHGTKPYTFSLFGGTDTPPGLTLDSGGTLSGVPENAGSYTFIVLVEDYKGCTSIHTYSIVICKDVVLDPVKLPPGTAGNRYTVDIREGGSRFILRDLPDWLSPIRLSPIPPACVTDVQLSGTPNAKGNNTFTVVYCDTQCLVSRTYTIDVDCPQITFIPPDLPNGTVGTTYAKRIRADGGSAPYTYAPTNLATVPTLKPGPQTFHVEATDANGCSGTHDYVVNVECPAITVFPQSLPTDAVSVQLSAGNLPFRYEFTLSPLPVGATLTKDGLLSWADTPSGDYMFTVTATHKESGCAGSRLYTLHVPPPCLITISPATLSRGTLLMPYSKIIDVMGGTPPYVINRTGTIPPGLGFPFPALTPQPPPPISFSGIPTVSGSYTFTITATDSLGCSASQTYMVAIDPPLVPGPIIPMLSPSAMLMLSIVLACAGLIAIRRMS